MERQIDRSTGRTDSVFEPRQRTIGVFSWLDAHVRLPLVQATLPLSVLLLHRSFGPVLGVDVGQVGRGIVVGLQRVVVFDLAADEGRERENKRAEQNKTILLTLS